MYSGIYASVDLPPLFVVVPVACTLGGDAGRRIPIVCGHKKYLRSCPRKYSSMIRDNFLFVDLAQLFEQFAERSLDFAAQRCKVLAHQRRIMCIGRLLYFRHGVAQSSSGCGGSILSECSSGGYFCRPSCCLDRTNGWTDLAATRCFSESGQEVGQPPGDSYGRR